MVFNFNLYFSIIIYGTGFFVLKLPFLNHLKKTKVKINLLLCLKELDILRGPQVQQLINSVSDSNFSHAVNPESVYPPGLGHEIPITVKHINLILCRHGAVKEG